MGYIYKITNKTDGKIYVGQTIQPLDERFRQHRKKSSRCRYLKRAFEKYGFDNFVFEMICICFDEDLDKFEIQYMTKFNSIVPNGYNLRAGGNSGRHNEETKKKISATLKGRTDIVRNYSNHIGKKLSEKTKKKISDALGRKVNQYDLENNLIKTFNSISEAAKETNIDNSTIGKCCNKRYKTSGGFVWKFYD